MTILAYQPPLRPALPCIYGPLDYREQRKLIERIDHLLVFSGLEDEFVLLCAAERGMDLFTKNLRHKETFVAYCRKAMRANIARGLTGMSHRDFCVRLADSTLLQWFLHISEVDKVKPFSKSTDERLSKWVNEETMKEINARLTALLIGEVQAQVTGLEEPIDCSDVFFDSTCLKANIHFPVDWVLLRDAIRTLMKALVLIRNTGLKVRMPQEPLEFLSAMNSLCMQMSGTRRKVDGKRKRKQVLRKMKALVKRVAVHADSHVKLMEEQEKESGLSANKIKAIKERIDNVLEQLPAAIKQAHERIIGGRQVASEDKILSLYEKEVNVVVRGKASGEVEFGNKLWVGETREGLIVDYKLYRENPSDSTMIESAMERLVGEQKLEVKNAWGDRGLHSKANEERLEKMGIRSGLCPRSVVELEDRLRNETGFREGLKRRAGTEARIGIFINVFMNKRPLAKGFVNRELAVGWAVLTHNLWVVARKAKAEEDKRNSGRQKAA